MEVSNRVRFILLAAISLSLHLVVFSQTSEKQNPVLFVDETLGGAFGDAGGLALGLGIHYQVKRNLFTARYTGTANFSVGILDPLIPLPYPLLNSSLDEIALLYGQRFIDNGHAYGISLGASYNHYRVFNKKNDSPYDVNSKYIGLPFEANIKWFKSVKKRFRIYGLIPVGKPTAFGGSIGFKFFGNISKQSYAGIGLSYGLGYHKVYNENLQ